MDTAVAMIETYPRGLVGYFAMTGVRPHKLATTSTGEFTHYAVPGAQHNRNSDRAPPRQAE